MATTPKTLTLKGAHIREIGGYSENVTVKLSGWREKRNGKIERYEIDFIGLSDSAMYCLLRHMNKRMGKMQEYFSHEAERVRRHFPHAEAEWEASKEKS